MAPWMEWLTSRLPGTWWGGGAVWGEEEVCKGSHEGSKARGGLLRGMRGPMKGKTRQPGGKPVVMGEEKAHMQVGVERGLEAGDSRNQFAWRSRGLGASDSPVPIGG